MNFKKKKALIIFLGVVLVHVILFIFKAYIIHQNDAFEQENFSDYVASLRSGRFPEGLSYADRRFFPGLPLLIYLFSTLGFDELSSGLLITFISLAVIFFISYKLTKNLFYSGWLTIFPPIVFEQTSKVSTEAPVIALLLLIYFLFQKKKYLLLSFLSGFALVVRPISVCIFLAFIVELVSQRKFTRAIKILLIFLIFPSFLWFFNITVLKETNPLYQFSIYQNLVRPTLGIFQLFADIIRAAEWGQMRILFSGLAYVIFSLFLVLKLFQDKTVYFWVKLWALFSMVFIYAFVPTPFLEEIRRFMSVFFPLSLLVLYKYFWARKKFILVSLLFTVVAFV